MLLVNLNDSNPAGAYLEDRRLFDRTYYNQSTDKYFPIASRTPGVNHGILFSLELLLVMKIITGRVLTHYAAYEKEKAKHFNNDLMLTKRFRSELITTLDKIQRLSISELGELERVMVGGSTLSPSLKKPSTCWSPSWT
ncbi:MAG: hypothetical protein HUJ67_08105 [Ruminiclostridium sp.]|nr:hypothetical protein [Ruminiclostridium sp.]